MHLWFCLVGPKLSPLRLFPVQSRLQLSRLPNPVKAQIPVLLTNHLKVEFQHFHVSVIEHELTAGVESPDDQSGLEVCSQ